MSLYVPSDLHTRVLRITSVASAALTIILMYSAAALPPFDSSPNAILPGDSFADRLARPLLRWDAFYFVHIAEHGYAYEHEWAFFPGAPLVMKTAASTYSALTFLPWTRIHKLLVGCALASTLCGSTSTLYKLTFHHFGSQSLAFLASLLSLLPSSPATLRFSVYNEPFFTFLSYKGMLCCARSEWVRATLYFAAASTFRSNGILLSIYILWGLAGQPLLARQLHLLQVCKAACLSLIIATPFGYHQYRAWSKFCVEPPGYDLPAWCARTPPTIYGYVQDYYWNVGFLRYWTPSQLPNILLAVPPLLILYAYSITNMRTNLVPSTLALLADSMPKSSLRPNRRIMMALSVTPHAVHSLALASVLLFAAHTQIALRLVASLPLTYWAAAWLMLEHPRAGKWWVAWSVMWGAISVVLWAVFLPPA